MGKHSLKFGAELYIMKANNNTPVSNLNTFGFTAGWTQHRVRQGRSGCNSGGKHGKWRARVIRRQSLYRHAAGFDGVHDLQLLPGQGRAWRSHTN